MNLNFKSIGIHIAIVVSFIVIAVLYFKPVLQGDVIYQSDIVQYSGMAKERNDYKQETGTESYWTNSAFGGMPTYQLGANYPHNYIKSFDKVLRFLPRPADYVFLYLLSFYILMLVLKVDYRLAFLGSLAFAFSTYYIIILGVGHNAKAHAIAYFPMVLAGILLVFKRKYFWGAILTALALSLEIVANHFQMTYYLLLLVLIIGIVYFIEAIKNKELPTFFKSVGVLIIAAFLAVLTNASNLLATSEYTKWSTRGKSELTFNPDGSERNTNLALDRDYITYYSYGVVESLNLLVPRMFGGSNAENLGDNSKTYDYLTSQGVPASSAKEFSKNLPTYWGPQPGTAAPAYIGAIVLFLFCIGLFLVENKYKWWLVAGALMSLFLSWGKNFSFLTDLMIDYFPLYDKLRAVSSIQVIIELCAPIMAIMALVKVFDKNITKEAKVKAVKWSGIFMGGLLAVLFLLKSQLFNFVSANDATLKQYYGADIVRMIVEDRKAIYNKDLFRSFILIGIAFSALWFYIKGSLKYNFAVGALIVLVAIDLIGVDLRYVNEDDFVNSRKMDIPFTKSAVDNQILKDTTDYRVFDTSEGLNGARTSYFFNSIGGYHGAKPRRLQELFEYQIANNNVAVLNMLNVKYIIRPNQEGQPYPAVNPYVNGSAWFVSDVKKVNSDDEAMKAMDSLDTKSEAIVNVNAFKELSSLQNSYSVDSLATIQLVEKKPDYLKYKASNTNNGLALFSEMYYPHGWKATIDGKEVPQFRANYALRAIEVPAGSHTIEFTFEPSVVATGSTLTLAGNIILFLLIVGGIGYQFKSKE
ncbi:YfhO family protein [Neptunitalea lumnitzerae]|uniref:Membrane protein n=1 Tax=Neptunitalea lumnitzerae TaxID=2965509 RepID=A0ABQ5MJA2_9FLAO|nr:YfhO family protein [Neptunitalea sp. Y10]GLB49469.1 membrane protein [Neptunitalea sp. Y10]